MGYLLFDGLKSVSDRVIYTNKGPIVKKPVSMLTGSDLLITSPNSVKIKSIHFNQSMVGKIMKIEDSDNEVNNGEFHIGKLLNYNTVELENVNFYTVDDQKTIDSLVILANELKQKFNQHVLSDEVHVSVSSVSYIMMLEATDFTSVKLVINKIKQSLNSHYLEDSHKFRRPALVQPINAVDLKTSLLLLNELHNEFNKHILDDEIHVKKDFKNRLVNKQVSAKMFNETLTGPLNWTILEPNYGVIADDPSDVTVRVNGSVVSVDYVIGLLGAIVLTNKVDNNDDISIDYEFLSVMSTPIKKLNTSQFNIGGRQTFSGFNSNKYKVNNSLVRPKNFVLDHDSMLKPKSIGWKYRATETIYTASLNRPNTLLLNVPTNKIKHQVSKKTVKEFTIKYDPSSLPNNSTDPWGFVGDSQNVKVLNVEKKLQISDSDTSSGHSSVQNFFHHDVNLSFDSIISIAFNVSISQYVTDGVFTGVCFGISNTTDVTIVGFIETKATNISSSIQLSNDIKSRFNAHILNNISHNRKDTDSSITMVDSFDLPTLLVLANQIKKSFNDHIVKDLELGIHNISDVDNVVTTVDAKTVEEAIVLLNDIFDKYNSHLVSTAHITNDTENSVKPVKQIGFLNKNGPSEDQNSWNCAAVNWDSGKTYRVSKFGNTSRIFLSGVYEPIASINDDELPNISSIDAKFNTIQQVFFGSIGRESRSTSSWSFVRVNVNPINSLQVYGNKDVDYSLGTVPDLANPPWISVGDGGTSYIYNDGFTDKLVIDSTECSNEISSTDIGLVGDSYKGFTRIEPSMSDGSMVIVDFRCSVGFYTFSIDAKSVGVFIEDNRLSSYFVFLQSTPSKASVTSYNYEPFSSITSSDVLSLSVDSVTKNIIFSNEHTAESIKNTINAQFGKTVAHALPNGYVEISSEDGEIGENSAISIFPSTAAIKLGFVVGSYRGSDSNPEHKLSWFGDDKPENHWTKWEPSGSQTSTLLDRNLRINDDSTSDFLVYTNSNQNVIGSIIDNNSNWKFDAKLSVASFTPGDELGGLRFCGVLINIDEGVSGKNLELHYSVDNSDQAYVNILTYDSLSGGLNSVGNIPFDWKDGKQHTINVYTSKLIDRVTVCIDNHSVNISRSSLMNGVAQKQISFGSGGFPVSNGRLDTSKSVVDWTSVSIFQDKKIDNASSSTNRYIGLYKGGDQSSLDSYYLTQIDWTQLHSYRITCDTAKSIALYIDGNQAPSISVDYNSVMLPYSKNGFFQKLTNGLPSISFGSFNHSEIQRTFWEYVKYSIGNITTSDKIIHAHNVNNYGNSIVSHNHMLSKKNHDHLGFNVYSGGTPTDDVIDNSTPSVVLNEGTPIVPMTKSMSNNSYTYSYTDVGNGESKDIVNGNGFLSNLYDDTDNAITSNSFSYNGMSTLRNDVGNLCNAFESHMLDNLGVDKQHGSATSITWTSPNVTLSDAYDRLKELRGKVITHFNDVTVSINGATHEHADVENTQKIESITFKEILFKYDSNHEIVFVDENDLQYIYDVINILRASLKTHELGSSFHITDDTNHIATVELNNALSQSFTYDLLVTKPTTPGTKFGLLYDFVEKYNSHLAFDSHYVMDTLIDSPTNTISLYGLNFPTFTGLFQLINFVNGIKKNFNNHISNKVHNQGNDQDQVVSYHFDVEVDDEYSTSIKLSDAYDYESLVKLMTELVDKFNKHITLVFSNDGKHIHTKPNTSNTEKMLSPFNSLIETINNIESKFYSHRLNRTQTGAFHSMNDGVTTALPRIVYDLNSFNIDFDSVIKRINALRGQINSHLVKSSVHENGDTINLIRFNGSTVDEASSFMDACDLLYNIITSYNSHINGRSWHKNRSDINAFGSLQYDNHVNLAISLVNDMLTSYNSHVLNTKSHIKINNNEFITALPANSLQQAIGLFNIIKNNYDKHVKNKLHVHEDTVNVYSGDVTNLSDLSFKGAELKDFMLKHYIEPGVHGNCVLINVSINLDDKPYDDLKIFKQEEGDDCTISTISDVDSLNIGGMNYTNDQIMTYPGNQTPDKTVIVGNKTAPFEMENGDAMTVDFDNATHVVSFSSSDSTTQDILNEAIGVFEPNEDGRIRVQSNSDRDIVMTGDIDKLGFNTAQISRWKPIFGDESKVSVTNQTTSGVDYLVMDVNGTSAVYTTNTGLVNSPSEFSITFSLKIVDSDIDQKGDSGIYVGFSSPVCKGITVAVGFEEVSSVKYIKIVDLNSNKTVFRSAFKWNDDVFHTYKLEKLANENSLSFTVLS